MYKGCRLNTCTACFDHWTFCLMVLMWFAPGAPSIHIRTEEFKNACSFIPTAQSNPSRKQEPFENQGDLKTLTALSTVFMGTENILKRICGSVKSYSERLAELNWSTLELRRKYLRLVQLCKIIHVYSDVDCTRFIDLSGPTRTRRNHDFKIRPIGRLGQTNLNSLFLTVMLMIGTLYLILLCQLPVWMFLKIDYWIIFVLSC